METVLIFQDAGARSHIQDAVQRAGFSYVVHTDLDDTIERLYSSSIKVVLLDDERRSGPSSTEAIKSLRRVLPSIQALVLVKSITTQGIIDLIKEGAFDVLADYHIPERLDRLVTKASEAALSYNEQRNEPARA